ncbi:MULTISPECIES: zeta toxin family protein [Pasteurellaceae]|uniref:Zeta toxin family protein n=1 Tax=Pasteurella atlantica TaxID=2827233 RepID=A0AAW8CIX0_9PAST|nr:zeta toxin family protein [Pasteurella atlantica]MBR0572893.1 zeta toxin family protein [Pasteurella atlantica]MDP8038821.1 zeta toxin family protein [Pasteurella atlantica]MDP8040912.1 zeta toxin family protein [Pasteurella atlantica]MDP8042914.1 zeta toxin family protein [Pasteurella atlantica]MDP8045001.1 zeta toxin family protein [Pasteurella atlantica]
MQNNISAIFYCGTNGAGKSTLRDFNQDPVQIVIDSDHIAQRINPDNPRLADLEAGRKAIQLFNFAIKEKIPFSMESTLSGKSIIKRIEKAKNEGFNVKLNYVGVNNYFINIERVKARVQLGGHFIDEEIIKNRYDISNDNLIKVISLCDEIFIYDNSQELPKVIFYISDNTIIQLSDIIPTWCQNLLKILLVKGLNLD